MSTVNDTALTEITANGDEDINVETGEDYIVSIAGGFDSASITFFFVQGAVEHAIPTVGSSDAAGSPLTVTAAAVFRITALTATLRLTVASIATAATLDIVVTKVRNK
tara:strand:- start:5321 stop:5644 length:324 start_codon:yes stop_codon:yes gene_type:complete